MRVFFAISALCLAVGAALSPAAAQSTFGTGVLVLSPAVRSYGMGGTGAADTADPLNAFYNPAVVPGTGEVFFAGIYSPLLRGLPYDFHVHDPADMDDVRGAQAVVGAGFSFDAGGAIGLRAGGSIAYSRLDYGDFFYDSCPFCLWSIPYRPGLQQALNLTAGGEASYRERVRLGFGFAVKPVWYRQESRFDGEPAPTVSGVAFDLGFLLSGDLLKTSDLRLSASAGFSILNMEIEADNHHYRDLEMYFPKKYRAGFGLRLEGPRTAFLGKELPIGTLTVNLDSSSEWEVTELARANGDYWGVGMEAAVLDLLFVRFGYLDERLSYSENREYDAADYTVGVGIGLTAKAFRVRLDYATVPQPAGLENADKFGVTCGVNF